MHDAAAVPQTWIEDARLDRSQRQQAPHFRRVERVFKCAEEDPNAHTARACRKDFIEEHLPARGTKSGHLVLAECLAVLPEAGLVVIVQHAQRHVHPNACTRTLTFRYTHAREPDSATACADLDATMCAEVQLMVMDC
eukprot:6075582-Pleurochrysis_carterae.AAC.1